MCSLDVRFTVECLLDAIFEFSTLKMTLKSHSTLKRPSKLHTSNPLTDKLTHSPPAKSKVTLEPPVAGTVASRVSQQEARQPCIRWVSNHPVRPTDNSGLPIIIIILNPCLHKRAQRKEKLNKNFIQYFIPAFVHMAILPSTNFYPSGQYRPQFPTETSRQNALCPCVGLGRESACSWRDSRPKIDA
jgi:hypothetical protein